MSGLAQYFEIPRCPYPPDVIAWAGIPEEQIQSFTPAGFQRSDVFVPGSGMGNYIGGWDTGLQSLSPSGGLGMFESGLDFSQWGAVEWTLVGLGVYVVGSLISDVGRGAGRVKRAVRPRRRAAA